MQQGTQQGKSFHCRPVLPAVLDTQRSQPVPGVGDSAVLTQLESIGQLPSTAVSKAAN